MIGLLKYRVLYRCVYIIHDYYALSKAQWAVFEPLRVIVLNHFDRCHLIELFLPGGHIFGDVSGIFYGVQLYAHKRKPQNSIVLGLSSAMFSSSGAGYDAALEEFEAALCFMTEDHRAQMGTVTGDPVRHFTELLSHPVSSMWNPFAKGRNNPLPIQFPI